MTSDYTPRRRRRSVSPWRTAFSAVCVVGAATLATVLPPVAATAAVAIIVVALLVADSRPAQEKSSHLDPSAVHEILHPVATTAGHVALVIDDPSLAPSHRTTLERALEGTRRTRTLVHHFSTPSDAPIRLVHSSPDLTELVCEALADFSPLADQRRVSMSLDAPPTCRVTADPHRLRQVVDNLLSNAVKYNVDGGWVDITVLGHDHEVVLVVENPGHLLSESELPHVFTDTFRGHSGATTVAGTGLGLGACRQIVEAHGGRIDLDSSQETRTTTVRVTLPNDG